MTNPKTEISALESLREQRRLAEGFRDAAEAYLQAIDAAPRPRVEVGGFYVTFDRSLVYIARPVTKCTCPRCTAAAGGQQMLMLGGMAFQIELPSAPQADEEEAWKQGAAVEHEPPKRFVCSILRGGHGIKRLHGEQPGETFVVDADGFVVLGVAPDANVEVVSNGILGMAGLSLARRVQVKVVEEKPVEPVFAEMTGGGGAD